MWKIQTSFFQRSNITDDIDDVFNLPEVNLRATMVSFYIGIGLHDVGSTLSFLGIPGGHS